VYGLIRSIVWGFVLAFALIMHVACNAGNGVRSGNTAAGGSQQLSKVDLDAIAGYVPPDGVDPALFEMLRDRLLDELRALQSGAVRKASATLPLVGFRVSETPAVANFSWRYSFPGDNDINGEVSIADITPIALNYLASTSDGTDDIVQFFIDGDQNGELGVSDITPIALNYLNIYDVNIAIFDSQPSAGWTLTEWRENARLSVDASITGLTGALPLLMNRTTTSVEYGRVSCNLDVASYEIGPGSYYFGLRTLSDPPRHFQSAQFTLGAPPPVVESVSPTSGAAGAQVAFSVVVSSGQTPFTYFWDFGGGADPSTSSAAAPVVTLSTAPGDYAASVTVSNLTGSDTFEFTLSVTGQPNEPPVARLTADPLSGEAPLTVNFDAGGSTDPESLPLAFEWDWEGDGTYDFSSGPVATAQHVYAGAGDFNATMRVTDSAFQSDTASVLISVSEAGAPEWHISVLDGLSDDASYSASLAEINGRPAVTYCGFEPYEFRYIRALDAVGQNWAAPIVLDTDGGDWSTLLMVNGRPAASYYYRTAGDLRYIRAEDPDGESWGEPVTLADEGDLGQYCSMAIISGNPAVSFWLNGGNGMAYVRAADPDGNVWNEPLFADSRQYAGKFTSLKEVDGKPAISYIWEQDQFFPRVCYVRALDAYGDTWGEPVLIDPDSDGWVGHTSLQIVNGNPAIAYFGKSPVSLRYSRSLDAQGQIWPAGKILDEDGIVGMMASMAVMNGNPAIAYHCQDTRELLLIRADDPDGEIWGGREVIDTEDETGVWPSFKIINGIPMIAYTNLTNLDLMFAVYY